MSIERQLIEKYLPEAEIEDISRITDDFIKKVRDKAESSGYNFEFEKDGRKGIWTFQEEREKMKSKQQFQLVGFHGEDRDTCKIITQLFQGNIDPVVTTSFEEVGGEKVEPTCENVDIREYKKFLEKVEEGIKRNIKNKSKKGLYDD